jgi:hypothetical protein
LQLSFAVFPLVMFTSSRVKMGELVAPQWLIGLARISHTFCNMEAIPSEKVSLCKSLATADQADPFQQSVFSPQRAGSWALANLLNQHRFSAPNAVAYVGVRNVG